MLNKLKKNQGWACGPTTTTARSGFLAVLGLVLALTPVAAFAQAQGDDFDYAGQSLRVGVWLEDKNDGDVLQKGEKFNVGFQVNQDAYAVVYHIDSEGFVSVLWPRSRFDDGFIFGAHEYQLPVAGARRLVAGGETGEGFVEAVVSSYPFDLRDLELDFHHEYTDTPWNFQVAGDPFLAMNEVNHVVTGLEDSGDYVVTNYLTYYVHQKVDHPRYLCSQCHFQDEVAYNPYSDTCTLEISHDYSWNNRWYDTYGYYPVYGNPVYVYVDPWTWRPWVNFWYNPWYTCAPSWGWGWNYSCYSWYDSPYYWGDSYRYYDGGHRRYRPLDRTYAAGDPKLKTREFSRVSSLIGKTRPGDSVLSSMRSKTALADARRPGGGAAAARGDNGRIRSVDRVERPRASIQAGAAQRGDTGGLRIRENTNVRVGGEAGRAPARHTAGGGGNRSTLTPVRRADDRSAPGNSTIRTGKPAANRNGADKPAASRTRTDKPASGDRTIKPVEPRKKDTRIWNARPGTTTPERSVRVPSNRSDGPSTPSRTTNPGSAVKPAQRPEAPRSPAPATPRVKSSGNQRRETKASGSNSSGSKSSGSKSSGNTRDTGGSKTRTSGSSSQSSGGRVR